MSIEAKKQIFWNNSLKARYIKWEVLVDEFGYKGFPKQNCALWYQKDLRDLQ